ncbi:uncharacterized protein LOC135085984 isoform X1 [Ostrinia nubilalis]|uniref:uncharacterized protein LOC135085984 isoform X1 n=1 Tax=Ostrinia nubilalis TaxID=29057 RepID=UPI00308266B3
MAEKRKRGQNFTIEDKNKLIQLLLPHKEIILNKKTDGATNELKNSAWIEITKSFNSSSDPLSYRTKKSLMKVWEKLKFESKNYSAQTEDTQTGRPLTLQIDPVMEQVCSFLGQEYTGMSVAPNCDADTGSETEKTQREEISVWIQPQIYECDIIDDNSAEEPKADDIQELQKSPVNKTPVWPRRRSRMSSNNERNEATSVSYSIQNVIKRKETAADLREQILREELEYKRKLYRLQLQAAAKEVEIKTAILDQIKGGGFSLNSLIGI